VFGKTGENPHANTLPDALDCLHLHHYSINADTTVTCLPRSDVGQREILTALGVTLPE
jgi:hypothetical protein